MTSNKPPRQWQCCQSISARTSYSVLDPKRFPVKDAGIDLIAYKLVLDDLEAYDLVVPPETHWYLNSKEALAKSGLPALKCTVITIEGHSGDVVSCCDLCRESTDGFSIPVNCAGGRGQWLTGQLAIAHDVLSNHPLPFVLKNQQTFGGAGTYFARTEDERQQLIRDLEGGVLRRLLSCLTSSSVHLAPGTLLEDLSRGLQAGCRSTDTSGQSVRTFSRAPGPVGKRKARVQKMRASSMSWISTFELRGQSAYHYSAVTSQAAA